MASDSIWAVAINATRARVLRDLMERGTVRPAELVMRAEHRHLRDIMADKPGRSFTSTHQGRRSAIEYGSDPLKEDQRDFVRQVTALLETHRLAGDFDKLVIAAEPSVLGLLRGEMPPRLARTVVAEFAKNLLHLSAQDLVDALSRELESGTA